MNEVSFPQAATAVAALTSLKKGLQNVQQSLIIKGGDPFLRLLKDGSWVYGQENNDVQAGSQWAVNPMSLMHGFIAWKDSEPVGEVMVPMTQPLPDRFSLNNPGADWDQQISWQLQCMSGDDKGTQVLYKATSVGAMNAANKLIAAISAQLDDDAEHPVPLIELLEDSYPHKKWGRVYVPVFTIKGWLALDGVTAEAAEAPAQAQGPEQAPPEPARRTRRTREQMAADAARQQPQTQQTVALDPSQMTVEELEAFIASKKANAATAAATVPAEDPAAKRRRELEAELAALTGGAGTPGQPAEAPAVPEPGQTIRRRRQ